MPKLPVYNRLFRKRHAHKQHCKKALVKSLKAKLKKALEAIQANEMFDADDADAAESSNIDATSTSTQTATARLEQQTIDFFKIHSPQVNFKDATKNPPNKSATLFPTIVLYCPKASTSQECNFKTHVVYANDLELKTRSKGKKVMHDIL